MSSHHLILNMDKTEVLVFYPDRPTRPLAASSISLQSCSVTPVSDSRDLGVLVDDQLSLRSFVNATARTCKLHLANIH